MFCKNCGTEMSDGASFCPKCGYNISGKEFNENRQIFEDNVVKYQLKSTFIVFYKMIIYIVRAILYLIIFCYFFPGLISIWRYYPYTRFITLGVVLLIMATKFYFEYLQYNNLEYNFYTTKIEYKDGFLNKEEKELKYKYIREVTMNQNILERIFNIGSIRIFTNASSGYNGKNSHNSMRGKNGIFIHCVENVQDNYKKIKEIIDEGIDDE